MRFLIEVTVCAEVSVRQFAPDRAGGLKGYLGCLFIHPEREGEPPRWAQDSVPCEPISDSTGIRTEQGGGKGKQGF